MEKFLKSRVCELLSIIILITVIDLFWIFKNEWFHYFFLIGFMIVGFLISFFFNTIRDTKKSEEAIVKKIMFAMVQGTPKWVMNREDVKIAAENIYWADDVMI